MFKHNKKIKMSNTQPYRNKFFTGYVDSKQLASNSHFIENMTRLSKNAVGELDNQSGTGYGDSTQGVRRQLAGSSAKYFIYATDDDHMATHIIKGIKHAGFASTDNILPAGSTSGEYARAIITRFIMDSRNLRNSRMHGVFVIFCPDTDKLGMLEQSITNIYTKELITDGLDVFDAIVFVMPSNTDLVMQRMKDLSQYIPVLLVSNKSIPSEFKTTDKLKYVYCHDNSAIINACISPYHVSKDTSKPDLNAKHKYEYEKSKQALENNLKQQMRELDKKYAVQTATATATDKGNSQWLSDQASSSTQSDYDYDDYSSEFSDSDSDYN